MLEIVTYVLSIPVALTFAMTLALLIIYIIKHQRDVLQHVGLPKVSVLVPFYNEESALLIKALTLLDELVSSTTNVSLCRKQA